MSNCILVNNVVHIANCLVIFNPSSICYLQLPITYKLSDFSLHIIWDELIPVFKKNYLSYKIFSFRVSLKGRIHRIENSFRISLIHCIEESCWSKVDIFELIVSIEPESIQMWMKGYEKFLIFWFAWLCSS